MSDSAGKEQAPASAGSEPEVPEEMSIAAEFMLFLRENKKWWLLPIIGMVLLLGALVVLSGTPAGPFIYSLF